MQILTLEGRRHIGYSSLKGNPRKMKVLTLEGNPVNLGLFKRLRRAVSSVAKTVTKNPLTQVAWQAAKLNPMVNMANQGLKVVSNVASGKNVLDTLVNSATGFIPGGDLVKQGIKIASDIASGKNVLNTLVNNASGIIPGGDLIKQGINTATSIAKGDNVFNALKDSVTGMIPNELKTAVSIIQNPSVLTKPENLLKMVSNDLLPDNMRNMANLSYSMIQNPKSLLNPSLLSDKLIPEDLKNSILELQNLAKDYPNMAESVLKNESEKLQKKINQHLVSESKKQTEKVEQKKKMVFVRVQFTNPLVIEIKRQIKEKEKKLLSETQTNAINKKVKKISMKKLITQIRSV